MSEAKKESRKLEEVQSEYHGLCTRTGHIQYQIHALTKDLALLNSQLLDLNLEAAALAKAKAEEDEKAKTEEVKS